MVQRCCLLCKNVYKILRILLWFRSGSSSSGSSSSIRCISSISSRSSSRTSTALRTPSSAAAAAAWTRTPASCNGAELWTNVWRHVKSSSVQQRRHSRTAGELVTTSQSWNVQLTDACHHIISCVKFSVEDYRCITMPAAYMTKTKVVW